MKLSQRSNKTWTSASTPVRRWRTGSFSVCSTFSLPVDVYEQLKQAAEKRLDRNCSHLVTEAVCNYLGITLDGQKRAPTEESPAV